MYGPILTTEGASLKMGTSLALANEIPDIWNETPSGTTVFLKGVKSLRLVGR